MYFISFDYFITKKYIIKSEIISMKLIVEWGLAFCFSHYSAAEDALKRRLILYKTKSQQQLKDFHLTDQPIIELTSARV